MRFLLAMWLEAIVWLCLLGIGVLAVQTMRRHALSDLPPCYTPSSVGDGLSVNPFEEVSR